MLAIFFENFPILKDILRINNTLDDMHRDKIMMIKDIEMAYYLIKTYNLKLEPRHVHMAAEFGNKDMAKLLIKLGCTFSAQLLHLFSVENAILGGMLN